MKIRQAMRAWISVAAAIVMMSASIITVNAETSAITVNAEMTPKTLADSYEGKTVVLQTNDVHGAVEGYQYAAGLKKELESRGADVVLVDCGDFLQGSIYVADSKGASAAELMNMCGYSYTTLGNHEFDYGTPRLIEILKTLEETGNKTLCANIISKDTGKQAYASGDLYISSDSDLKIGFFGLATPESLTKSTPGNVSGMDFQGKDAMYETARNEINELEADGADVVVCLAHLGTDKGSAPFRSYDLYDETKDAVGADGTEKTAGEISERYIILDGHSHTVMTHGTGGEPIMSTGTKLMNIGMVVINETTEKIESSDLFRLRETDSDSAAFIEGLPSDDAIREAAEKCKEDVDSRYNEKIAVSEAELNGSKSMTQLPDGTYLRGNRDGETNTGDLITDAFLWYGMEHAEELGLEKDTTVALVNGGSVRAAVAKGNVTRKDILNVMPFGNTLCVVRVPGGSLLEALEASTFCTPKDIGGFPQVSGIEYELDETAEYKPGKETYPDSTYYGPESISRVTIKSVNGKPFDEKKTYALLVNNFCAAGGDTYYALKISDNIVDTGITDEIITEMYIMEELDGRIGEEYKAPQGRIDIVQTAHDAAAPEAEKAVKDAEAVLASGDYTTETRAEVTKRIKELKELLDNRSSSAAAIKKAGASLESAVKALKQKAKQHVKVSAAKKTVKASALKKKARTVKAIKVKGAKGAVTYSKRSGSKRLSINSRTGKIKIRKGTKKGTYKIKVRVRAAGDGTYKSGSKTVKVRIRVKG